MIPIKNEEQHEDVEMSDNQLLFKNNISVDQLKNKPIYHKSVILDP